MPGEGFMLHANNTMRDNKKMLRKKSYFRREKGFLNLKEEYLKATINKKLDFRKLTKEELEQIRKEVIEKTRKENIKAYTLTIISFLLVSSIIYFIGNNLYRDYIKYIPKNFPQKIENTRSINKTENFHFLIQSGDEWMNKMNWKNAVFQYENALSIFPNHTETKIKLVDAYTNMCYFEQIDCDKAIDYINKILKEFPKNEKLLESKSLLEQN